MVGAGPGAAPAVNVYNSDGSLHHAFLAFEPSFTGGVRVAVGDLTGDAVPDIAVGTGPGRQTQVKVFDGGSGAELYSIQPFEPSFTGGVFLAIGHVPSTTGAAIDNVLVVSPDVGGGPRVLVYQRASQFSSFLGFDDPNFRGGARVAMGNLTSDRVDDLIVAAGPGGGPRVALFDGNTILPIYHFITGGKVFVIPPALNRLENDFFAFEPSLRNGVYVAAGHLDDDGREDLIFGSGLGSSPRVYALAYRPETFRPGGGPPTVLANFYAGNPDDRDGVRVAARDLDGDGRADILTSSEIGSRVRAYRGSEIASAGAGAVFRDFEPFPVLTAGVFVA